MVVPAFVSSPSWTLSLSKILQTSSQQFKRQKQLSGPFREYQMPLNTCANDVLKRLINSEYCCHYKKQEDKEDWEHIKRIHHC